MQHQGEDQDVYVCRKMLPSGSMCGYAQRGKGYCPYDHPTGPDTYRLSPLGLPPEAEGDEEDTILVRVKTADAWAVLLGPLGYTARCMDYASPVPKGGSPLRLRYALKDSLSRLVEGGIDGYI